MNSHIDFTQPGGLWFTQDVLKFMQETYGNPLDGIAAGYGEKCVVSGVREANGSVSNGWVVYLGELVPFVGSTIQPFVDSEDTISSEQFDDGTTKNIYYTRRLKMVSIATQTSFPYADLVRPSLHKNTWLKGDIKQVSCTAQYITDNFNLTTGIALPTSERAGWKIKFSAGGRVLVGWNELQLVDPNDNVYDPAYAVPGTIGGEKLHKLVTAELPRFRLSINTGDQPGRSDNANDRDVMVPGTSTKYTEYIGSDTPHENRMPFEVVLTLEKL